MSTVWVLTDGAPAATLARQLAHQLARDDYAPTMKGVSETLANIFEHQLDFDPPPISSCSSNRCPAEVGRLSARRCERPAGAVAVREKPAVQLGATPRYGRSARGAEQTCELSGDYSARLLDAGRQRPSRPITSTSKSPGKSSRKPIAACSVSGRRGLFTSIRRRPYPRYVKTNDPTGKTGGEYFGPIEDKHAAQKLVHTIENLFDLCRDYSILVQSPNGGPCPWKQMNKCVGPCDGTISLKSYREIVADSTRALIDPRDFQREHERRMQQAAAELRFETAEKIKSYIEQISHLGKGSFRHVRPLKDFRFVTLQRGPRAGTAKVFLITPGRVDQVMGLIVEPTRPADVLRHILGLSHAADSAVDDIGAERIGVVAHHLFQPKAKQGVFLPLETIDEKAITKAYRDLMNQKPPEDPAGEGLTKELQAL